jgi:hypothetical protein
VLLDIQSPGILDLLFTPIPLSSRTTVYNLHALAAPLKIVFGIVSILEGIPTLTRHILTTTLRYMRPNLNLYPHIILTQSRYPNTSPKRLMIRHPLLEIPYHGIHSFIVNRDMVRVDSVYLLSVKNKEADEG